MTYAKGRPGQDGQSHNNIATDQDSKAPAGLSTVLRAYVAYGGPWAPGRAGQSAFGYRCPLLCGPRADGQLWIDDDPRLPVLYLADYDGHTLVSCMNGCDGDAVLRAVGVRRMVSYGFGLDPRSTTLTSLVRAA